MTDYPQWVRERACELANEKRGGSSDWTPNEVGSKAYPNVAVIADLILKYETAPVDPVKEALAETYGGCAPEFLSAFHAAIERRGLKIVKVQP